MSQMDVVRRASNMLPVMKAHSGLLRRCWKYWVTRAIVNVWVVVIMLVGGCAACVVVVTAIMIGQMIAQNQRCLVTDRNIEYKKKRFLLVNLRLFTSSGSGISILSQLLIHVSRFGISELKNICCRT